eukprot:SAG11_NODE_1094_length_5900_cov_5.025685_3_plen_61_part_00
MILVRGRLSTMFTLEGAKTKHYYCDTSDEFRSRLKNMLAMLGNSIAQRAFSDELFRAPEP